MRDFLLGVLSGLVLVATVNNIELREQIIELQTDNATQWQQIRANNKDVVFMMTAFLEEFDITEEQLREINPRAK